MTQTEDTFYLPIPKLKGWKTIILQVVTITIGLAQTFFPGYIFPTPDALGLAYDQFMTLLVAVNGLLTIFFRMTTAAPPATPLNLFKLDPKITGDQHDRIYQRAFEDGLGAGRKTSELHALLSRDANPREPSRQPVGFPQTIPCDHSEILPDGHCRWCGQYVGLPPEAVAADRQTNPRVPVSPNVCDHPTSERLVMSDDGSLWCQKCGTQLHEEMPDPVEAPPSLYHGQDDTADRKPGTVRGKITGAVLAFFLAMATPVALVGGSLVLVGCGTVAKQIDAIGTAETTEQRAYALYSSYVILQERAAVMVRDTSLPKAVRLRIQQVDRLAHPAASAVRDTYRTVQQARAALQAGTGSAERVSQLSATLASRTASLATHVGTLTKAMEAQR